MPRDRRSELLALLTAYDPDDPAERRYRLEMLDLAAAAHDPYDRHEYRPGHFTASGFVLHPAGDRVLLLHHAKIGAWLQPGGHVDPDDDGPMGAAKREVSEETGVTPVEVVSQAVFDLDVHVFPAGHDQPEHRHYDVRFAFIAGNAALDPNHEALDVSWCDWQEAQQLGLDRSVLRPMGKLLGEIVSGR